MPLLSWGSAIIQPLPFSHNKKFFFQKKFRTKAKCQATRHIYGPYKSGVFRVVADTGFFVSNHLPGLYLPTQRMTATTGGRLHATIRSRTGVRRTASINYLLVRFETL